MKLFLLITLMVCNGSKVFADAQTDAANAAVKERETVLRKVNMFATGNGYITSVANDSTYSAYRNMENLGAEQGYRLTYGASMPLALECTSFKSKDIVPTELAQCRAEFVKVYQGIFGKRPNFVSVPYVSGSKDGGASSKKKFGAQEQFAVESLFIEQPETKKSGYKFVITTTETVH